MGKNQESEDLFVLCEHAHKLAEFIEFTPFAMAMFDKEMRYIAVSHRWIEDFALEGQELIGELHEDVCPNTCQQWRSAYRKALSGEIVKNSAELYQRFDGTPFWIRWELRPWQSSSGEIGGAVIFTEDITEKKQAEQSYFNLFNRTGTCTGIIESDGTFSMVNQTFADLADSSIEALVGTPFVDLVAKEDRARLIGYHQKRLKQESTPDHYEFCFLSKKGNQGTALINSTFIPEKLQTLVSIIDITDRKEAESELKEREQELSAIVENIPMMIFVKDAKELRYVRFNAAGEELTGVKREDLIGKNDYDIFPKEEADYFISRDREALALKQTIDIPQEPLHGKEGIRTLHTKKVSILDDTGEPKYLLGISEDITKKIQIEEAFQKEYERSSLILNSTLDGYILTDKDGNFLDVNPAYCRLTGYSRGELLSKNIVDLEVHENKVEMLQNIHEIVQTGTHLRFETKHRHKRGRNIDLDLSLGVMKQNDERFMVIFARDIREQKEKERQLLQSATVFENSSEGIVVSDAKPEIINVNPAFTRITGYSKEEVLGKNPRFLESQRSDRAFYEKVWSIVEEIGQWQGEVWNRRKNGEDYPEWLSISSVKDSKNRIVNYIGVFSDISKIKKTEDELRFLAHHDSLTQLPNRVLLNERLEHSLERAQRKDENLAVLYLDLDRFKEVNDGFGHPYGDKLLQEVAVTLSKMLRDEDTIARVSGDEFVIVLEDIRSPNDIAIIAQKILTELSSPMVLHEHEITITVSIGITVSPSDGNDVVTLLKNADTALHRAKELGRNSFEFFSADMATSSFEMLFLHSALHNALTNGEFILHYQPQFDMKSGKILGSEALVRWNSPAMGLVSPARFIPIAEDTGLIVPLGDWILVQACRQMKQWLDEKRAVSYVAVNVSGRQLSHGNIVQSVQEALAQTGLDAKHLEIEITESVIMKDELYIGILRDLQELGIRLSIDDFGTGYSSLSRLKNMPISKLKIDQSFVSGIPEDEDDMKITQAVIGLAKSLGLDVIAEGVETKEQVTFLLEQGCKKVQGYLYSRPQTAEDLSKWLKKNTHKDIL